MSSDNARGAGTQLTFSRGSFGRMTMAGTLLSLTKAFEPLPAYATSLPQEDEFGVMRRLGSLMLTIWPRGLLPAADGASEANKSGYKNVLFQYHTFGLLPLALLAKNTRYVDAMLRVAEYAFEHQNPDGSFNYAEANGTVPAGSKGALSAASAATFFVSDLGHTLLLLPQNPWFMTSTVCEPFRKRVTLINNKLGLTLEWLMTQRAILATDRAAANRIIAHALAFYFAGRVQGRADAMAVGRQIFQAALEAVTTDGVFIEGGGFDSSYQAFNILECEWMYLNLDPNDAALRGPTWAAIERGIARERGSVLPSGQIDSSKNTRIRENDPAYGSHHVNNKQVLLALGYFGVMANDDSIMALTRQVCGYYYPSVAINF